MPELPEVETVARDLHRALVGKKIISVKSLDKKFRVTSSEILKKPIKRVYRRAKMLIIDFGKYFLVFHFKMTGQLIYRSKKTIVAGGHPIVSTGIIVPNKFTRLIFSFKDGSPRGEAGKLYFNDLRKFGWVKVMSIDQFKKIDSSLGHEPLEKKFTFKKFQELLIKRKRTIIKAALLDQKLVAGLGNIYVDEVLFRSHVRPQRRVDTLAILEQKKIWRSIPIILKKSIARRGTTFSNFLDADGLKGNFVSFLKVYGRGQKPCRTCGRLIKKIRVAQRGTHWCEYCQK